MRKKRIFIIDDEQMFTDIVKLNLESSGVYEVEVRNSAVNAIPALAAFAPDLIFLDVIMPEIDGAQLLEQIENNAQLKNTPIVFLTALVNKKDVRSPLEGVMAGRPFLAKPVSTEQLMKCIQEYAAD